MSPLKRKIGPVPIWAIAVVGVGGTAYYIHRRNMAAADAGSQDVAGTPPPTGADPSSTLPYGVTQTDPAAYAASTSGFNSQGIYTPVGYQAYNNGQYSVPGQMISHTRSPIAAIDLGNLITSLAAARVALSGGTGVSGTSGHGVKGTARKWWATHKPKPKPKPVPHNGKHPPHHGGGHNHGGHH